MPRVKLPSKTFKFEVFKYYYINPFKSINAFYIPFRLLILPLFLLHFFTKLFYISDDDYYMDYDGDNKAIGCLVLLFRFVLIFIGYAFGLLLIPIQWVTFAFVYIYILTSVEKTKNFLF